MTLAPRWWATGLGVVAASACSGQDDARGEADPIGISIQQVVAVEPVLDDVAALYLSIRNAGTDDDTLVMVETASAGRAEIHAQMRDEEMVHMGRRERVVIPAAGTVLFAPGGLHVMLMELTEPVAAGDTLDVDFRFARAGLRTARVPVVSYGDLP